MLSTLDLVAEALQTHGKLRTIYTCRVMVRLKETALLQCACLAVLSLRNVENHSVGVKLWCRISVNRPRRIMLEGRCDELACRFRRMNIADPSLCVALQFMQCDTHTFAMCFA